MANEIIEDVEKFKEQRSDLVELFSKMDRDQLLNQIFLESMDAVNMETRVSEFMELCTNMSKTNYTLESIRAMVNEKQENDIDQFCWMTCEDASDEEILEEIKKRAITHGGF